ncbi:MAG: NUDIX hydrolase [Eubacterium sp.]|uniref:NUDIX hydrolase n=1 Tax=Eubacterium sp. TaxID=142586 RepID=UPI00300E8F68
MAELWDAYNKNFNKIENKTLIRGESIPDGAYHLVSEIVVKHTDGSYLLMQCDFRKHHGGKWKLTAGGSALQGEDELEAAVRKLKEETGLSCEMKEIGRAVHHDHHSFYVVYLCEADFEKDSIVLQEGETIGYKWVDKEKLLKMNEKELSASRTLALVKRLDL